MDRRLLKAMKALAELQDTSLGELFENLVLTALAGTPALGGELLTRARERCSIYWWPTLQYESAALAAAVA
jgi:hypothetical protein